MTSGISNSDDEVFLTSIVLPNQNTSWVKLGVTCFKKVALPYTDENEGLLLKNSTTYND